MQGERFKTDYDVVVAGARCAGASTGLLLARAGLSVLVVDPLPRGRDTLSTHALMRGGVNQLHRWGLLEAVEEADTPGVRTTSFHYGAEQIDIPIKTIDGVGVLYAPRRTVLDPILAEAAEAAGAQMEHGVAVTNVVRDGDGTVRGVTVGGANQPPTAIGARLVVGADGVRSRVARLVDAKVLLTVPHTAATMYGYWPELGIDGYHWYFEPGISGAVIPTNDDVACVSASVDVPTFLATPHSEMETLYFETLRALDPDLASLMAGISADVRLRAFPGLNGFIRQSVGPGWALVGDAGYFRDPLTAHGITDALREAEFLARAVLDGGNALFDYQPERDARVIDVLRVTDRIASLAWDMDEIQDLHLNLSKAMNIGVDAIRDLDAAVEGPAASSVP